MYFVPVIAIYIWHSSRIDKLERRISELEQKLHEASDQVFRQNMLNNINNISGK
jgi:hypothetical protein